MLVYPILRVVVGRRAIASTFRSIVTNAIAVAVAIVWIVIVSILLRTAAG